MSSLQNFSKFCHNELMNGKKVDVPRRFLTEDRGFNEKTFVKHGVGYCPWGIDLDPNVRYYGEDLESQDKRDWQWNIWGRIIVPIFNEFGEIVSLSTKKPTKEKNPWWNLPFVKSHVLFNMDKAKRSMFNNNKVYVVEGYSDAMTLYQHGLHNVVAIMGTALTLRKIALIARYCNNICFCFDVDENRSGQKASNTSIVMVNKYCFCENISVIDTIPIGEDPDSFVRKNGLSEYLKHERVLSSKDIKKICKRVDEKAKEAFYAK